MITNRALLTTYLRPQAPKFALLLITLLAGIALQLLIPQVLRNFIDGAKNGAPLQALLWAAAAFLACALFNQALSSLATYVGANVGWHATNRLRADLMRHVLSLDAGWHKDRTPGELIERIDGDVTALSNFFSQFMVRVLGSALLLIGILALLWREDWRVGLAVTVFAALGAAALHRTRAVAVPATADEREASAKLFGFIEERVAGLDDLRANGAGAYVMRRFTELTRAHYFSGRRAWWLRSGIWVITMGLFTLGYAVTLGLSIWLYAAGAVTIGTAYLFFQYTSMLESPLDQLTQQMQDLQKAAASLQRVRELLGTRTEVPENGTLPLPDGPLGLHLHGVHFAYGPQPVLNGVTAELRPGRVLGLLGRTGSGKTTLTRLVQRLHDPTGGQILLGGVDLRDVLPAQLRERVGVVTQDVQLFHASVRDNLTFFDGTVTDERILEALAQLGLDGWARALPQGLSTRLAPGGLSAGQAQLLAFARVFLKDPGLIILDEFSSRLDPATEAVLDGVVQRLLAGRTAIIIAHRLATVARADDILVLGDGQVLEHGPRETLALDPGSHFSSLLRAAQINPQLPEEAA